MRLNVRDGWWGRWPADVPGDAKPAGYAWMVTEAALDVMPNYRWSFTSTVGRRRSFEFQGLEWELFPSGYAPDGLAGQVEFALKYDGVNLEILAAWFERLDPSQVDALAAWVAAAPASAYARRAWFLFELLSGRVLDLRDATTGGYVRALDPAEHFVADARRSRRHRVHDNLPGGRKFCALVRRTPALDRFASRQLGAVFGDTLRRHDAETLARVVSYLYTKETRSSFQIERERPTADRVERFVAALRRAPDWPDLTRQDLVALQNLIVADPRSRDDDYREQQNYVGGHGPRELAFVSPRPEDLPELMSGWLAMVGRLLGADLDAVVAAAMASFSFVYLHPFEDGNGRIHRFLVHYFLARKRFVPAEGMVPVSATMLARMKEYDAALEHFSVPLLVRLQYDMDAEGRVEVSHDSSGFYRFPDLTAQAEALYGWVARSIESDVPSEIAFVLAYRTARARITELVELPDRLADQFVLRVMEQRGRLSNHRRRKDFSRLTDEEAAAMERLVREAMVERGMEVVAGE